MIININYLKKDRMTTKFDFDSIKITKDVIELKTCGEIEEYLKKIFNCDGTYVYKEGEDTNNVLIDWCFEIIDDMIPYVVENEKFEEFKNVFDVFLKFGFDMKMHFYNFLASNPDYPTWKNICEHLDIDVTYFFGADTGYDYDITSKFYRDLILDIGKARVVEACNRKDNNYTCDDVLKIVREVEIEEKMKFKKN
jgi:hypothetical protein